MNKTLPAVAIAVEFLERHINGNAFDAKTRLPSIKKLASMADVSLVTMWKAAQLLKQKGTVSIVHGQGIRPITSENHQNVIAAAGPDASPSPAAEKKWEVVKRLIRRDIVNGIYQPGEEMPSLKEMAFTYDTCFITLKKSLAALSIDNYIIPSRRTFRIVPLSNKKSRSHIIVLTRGEESGELNTWTPWGREFLQTLDKKCAQARITVSYYIYAPKDAGCVFIGEDGETIPELPVNDFVLGFLVRSQSEDDLHIALVQKLTKYKRYVAVSDEGACFTPPFSFADNPKIRLFILDGNASAGCKVARFLLHNGHKKVAFFSPFHQTTWSKTRLEGIIQTYESAGVTSAVDAYTIDNIPFPFGYRKPVSCGKGTMNTFLHTVLPRYRDNGDSLRIADHLRDSLERMAEEEELRASMRPFFEKAIQNTAASAWVCVNDKAAMVALDFLKLHAGVRRIELVSYDDTFEAFKHKITSYNFNVSALVNAMLLFVLYPRRERLRKYSEKPVLIEGTIVERAMNNRSGHGAI
jgi:DNA-binding transcriptional regulator YhcF (GntR family)/DNA-binding LacI/PurR family transcriptional regulator